MVRELSTPPPGLLACLSLALVSGALRPGSESAVWANFFPGGSLRVRLEPEPDALTLSRSREIKKILKLRQTRGR